MNVKPVDLVVIRRDRTPPPSAVLRGVESQVGVEIQARLVVGARRAEDPNRWATIVRARNEGARLGSAPWVMFLDDDVVLDSDCVRRLVEGLEARPEHAALAADYLGESQGESADFHVAMGATLFRREVLAGLRFRWEPGKCECQCCCDDLRRSGFGIAYLPQAQAIHNPSLTEKLVHSSCSTKTNTHTKTKPKTKPKEGRVLAAFDRGHLHRFRGMFLSSLRQTGNAEPVLALAYDVTPGEARRLEALPGVEVLALPSNGATAPVCRIRDFPKLLDRLDGDTPVAYWDAGDVLFQESLKPLWELAAESPDQILAVREPFGYPINPVVMGWTETIRDPKSRNYAMDLFKRSPYLNSGFVASTARRFADYCRAADQLIRSPALIGSLDWGDQTALNLYCHSKPERWREIPDGWNYCLCGRSRDQFRILPDGRIASRNGSKIRAVHGNDKTLRHLELSFLDV